ncbi:MAG: aggregation factor core [Pseudomonadota bacterium]
MRLTLATTLGLAIAAPASADIRATFLEGAPKDRFTVENTSACAIRDVALTIDLRPSQGGLIFDTTAQGQGVEVFQPFELTAGADTLRRPPEVADGDQALTLEIGLLPPGRAISFTIDVDDTRGGREITVNGDEITGAHLVAAIGGAWVKAPFKGPSAALPHPCAT